MSDGIILARFRKDDKIITMRRLLFVTVWTLFAAVLMFMFLEAFVVLFVASPRPTPGIIKRLGGTAIIIGREGVRIMKIGKGVVMDASMIEDSDELLFVISEEALPSYA